MKIASIVSAIALVSSTTAFALEEGKPFQLSPGRYSYRCSLEQTVLEKGETKYSKENLEGEVSISATADGYLETERMSFDGVNFEMTTLAKFTKLAEGKFLMQYQGDIKNLTDPTQVSPTSYFETIADISGAETKTLVSREKNQPFKYSRNILSWKIAADGKILTKTSFRDRPNMDESQLYHPEIINLTQECTYSQMK